ncbi:unnamed protein product [Adineta ricciae]|uniref:Small ribosomal subunit protein uS2 n=1 Tax=Adineta ricciae TaxID=249248 RepID=A0A813W340_ADIRI|nr:unnamed protein product [Adineta ricciae]
MKFWCASSQRKSLPKDNASFSSSASYASISSLPAQKSDSGFSETSSIIQPCSHFEQILFVERTYCEHLKEYITKYSRPLRRYLSPTEIVDLFQNIEKIFNVSKSIVRQCEKLLDEQDISHTSIGKIYQSSFGVMIDSYNVYISRSTKALRMIKQCCDKIAYFRQIPTDVVIRELTSFVYLPLRHIRVLNDLLQNANAGDILEAINFLSNQARYVLQYSFHGENSILDSTSQSEMSRIMVFQRTDTEPWESKQLELSQWKLSFTQIDQSVPMSTSVSLSNVIHIEQDASNEELCLLLASNLKTPTRYSSLKIKRIYVRFDNGSDYHIWLDYLRNAVQDAKDQNHQTKTKMTSGYSTLQLKDDDVLKILAAQLHVGSKDVNYQMDTYVWKKKPRNEAASIINVRKFWEKLVLAARAIVAVENPADVCAISCQPQGQRAVLKFAKYTGATAIAGRFTPGSFTNQIQAAFKEPRLIIITNPNVDHQAVSEASFVNIPVIGFCDPSTSLRYIDIAIPANNKANKSIGLMWWFLTREVLRLRGKISRQAPWEVMVDLFFYRDPEETEKEDQTAVTGQVRDGQQNADQGYYDEGPSMMPSSENYAGHQENWGASATEEWGTGAPAAGGESSWNPSSAHDKA